MDYGLRQCTPLALSNSGSRFAVVENGSFTILLVALYTGECMGKLRGHGGPITALSWSEGDRTLCSASSDGAVLFWDGASQQRLQRFEHVNKILQLGAVAAMAPQGHASSRAASGLVCELQNGQVVCEVGLPPGRQLPICLLAGGRVLIGGSSCGALLSYPWAPELPGPARARQQMQTPAHSSRVQHLRSVANETILVSAAADGTIIAWDMQVPSHCGRSWLLFC
jgi:WD40 repeat protein